MNEIKSLINYRVCNKVWKKKYHDNRDFRFHDKKNVHNARLFSNYLFTDMNFNVLFLLNLHGEILFNIPSLFLSIIIQSLFFYI